MYDIAVGDLGLSVDAFHGMSMGEFQCRYAGWLRRIDRDRDALRNVMWSALKPHIKKGKNFTPQSIFKLQSDKKPFEKVSIEEYKKLKNG